MLNSNMIGQLYDQIKNTNNEDAINWESVLEVFFKEKEKDPNKEFISLKNAIRVFLGASNDYDNVLFTRICEMQEELEGYYDELLKGFITSNSSLSEKRVEKMIKNLKIHHDLYAEIVNYLLAGNVYKSPLILEQGYDVKRLCSEFNLSIVGAYNFIIYLREEPDNALADLKAGLPRK